KLDAFDATAKKLLGRFQRNESLGNGELAYLLLHIAQKEREARIIEKIGREILNIKSMIEPFKRFAMWVEERYGRNTEEAEFVRKIEIEYILNYNSKLWQDFLESGVIYGKELLTQIFEDTARRTLNIVELLKGTHNSERSPLIRHTEAILMMNILFRVPQLRELFELRGEKLIFKRDKFDNAYQGRAPPSINNVRTVNEIIASLKLLEEHLLPQQRTSYNSNSLRTYEKAVSTATKRIDDVLRRAGRELNDAEREELRQKVASDLGNGSKTYQIVPLRETIGYLRSLLSADSSAQQNENNLIQQIIALLNNLMPQATSQPTQFQSTEPQQPANYNLLPTLSNLLNSLQLSTSEQPTQQQTAQQQQGQSQISPLQQLILKYQEGNQRRAQQDTLIQLALTLVAPSLSLEEALRWVSSLNLPQFKNLRKRIEDNPKLTPYEKQRQLEALESILRNERLFINWVRGLFGKDVDINVGMFAPINRILSEYSLPSKFSKILINAVEELKTETLDIVVGKVKSKILAGSEQNPILIRGLGFVVVSLGYNLTWEDYSRLEAQYDLLKLLGMADIKIDKKNSSELSRLRRIKEIEAEQRQILQNIFRGKSIDWNRFKELSNELERLQNGNTEGLRTALKGKVFSVENLLILGSGEWGLLPLVNLVKDKLGSEYGKVSEAVENIMQELKPQNDRSKINITFKKLKFSSNKNNDIAQIVALLINPSAPGLDIVEKRYKELVRFKWSFRKNSIDNKTDESRVDEVRQLPVLLLPEYQFARYRRDLEELAHKLALDNVGNSNNIIRRIMLELEKRSSLNNPSDDAKWKEEVLGPILDIFVNRGELSSQERQAFLNNPHFLMTVPRLPGNLAEEYNAGRQKLLSLKQSSDIPHMQLVKQVLDEASKDEAIKYIAFCVEFGLRRYGLSFDKDIFIKQINALIEAKKKADENLTRIDENLTRIIKEAQDEYIRRYAQTTKDSTFDYFINDVRDENNELQPKPYDERLRRLQEWSRIDIDGVRRELEKNPEVFVIKKDPDTGEILGKEYIFHQDNNLAEVDYNKWFDWRLAGLESTLNRPDLTPQERD
ncbi:MAG: hypothetical protein NC925_04260, partial [Candidatus Omnitrophica bacterium]|nr:hypothetical protein [Candidatus Omnitrophota bacterium]